MPLLSRLFRGDAKLEAAAVNDAAHILQGARGEHVRKIQAALNLLNSAALIPDAVYGPQTAAAVRAYKQKRRIINFSYQKEADDIVGKMTIVAMDSEMRTLIAPSVSVNFLLSATLTSGISTPQTVVVTENDPDSLTWAKQVVDFCTKMSSSLPIMSAPPPVIIPKGKTPAQIADIYKSVAAQAGVGGCIIISVGHGGASPVGDEDVGLVDLGPNNAFKVAGRNTLLVGEELGGKRRPLTIPPDMKNDDIDFFHTEVFYADPATPPRRSRKQDDESSGSQGAQVRLANWRAYEEICTAFKTQKVGLVVFLTCVVGKAPGMLRKMTSQWGCDIFAYKRLIGIGPASNRKERAFLQNDPEGTNPSLTTNTPLAEIMPPPSRDAVWIRHP
jgi:hypothetical protein